MSDTDHQTTDQEVEKLRASAEEWSRIAEHWMEKADRYRGALESIVKQATYIRTLPVADSFRDGLSEGWSRARDIASEALNV